MFPTICSLKFDTHIWIYVIHIQKHVYLYTANLGKVSKIYCSFEFSGVLKAIVTINERAISNF